MASDHLNFRVLLAWDEYARAPDTRLDTLHISLFSIVGGRDVGNMISYVCADFWNVPW